MSTARTPDGTPLCEAMYEPLADRRRQETHDCRLPVGHRGAHECTLCHGLWAVMGGRVTPKNEIAVRTADAAPQDQL